MSNIDNIANENRDVYASVTSHSINAIELAVGNWRMPWHASGCFAFSPINVASNKPCRGINVVGLWAALCQPYGDGLVTPSATDLEYVVEPLEQYTACACERREGETNGNRPI